MGEFGIVPQFLRKEFVLQHAGQSLIGIHGGRSGFSAWKAQEIRG
jgi:hypothetical protein